MAKMFMFRSSVSLLAVCLPVTAFAQQEAVPAPPGQAGAPLAQEQPSSEAPPVPPVTDDLAESGEIIVTAQRRSESLQRVPAAITAITGEQLARQGINTVQDVASRTPSFVIAQQGPASPDLTIRAIGSSDRDAGSDRSVIAFVDEVYTGRAGGIPADLFDLERVEVLRGPQGTLYGKNAVGGAVNFITRKPTDEFSAATEIGFGNFGLVEAKGAVGGGLSETVAGRFAFSTRRRDGFYDNARFDARSDDYRLAAGRIGLRWRPLAELDVLVSADYSEDETDGVATVVNPVSPALLATGFVPREDLFTGFNNEFGFTDRKIAGISLRADYDVGPGTITSLTAYRTLDLEETRDLAGVPLRRNAAGATIGFESTQILTEDTSSFSQELRFTSSDIGRLRYIAGLYYQTEDTERVEERKRQLNASRSRPVFDQSNKTESYAAFGQLTWAATDWLNVTAGTRYTVDSKDFGLTVTNPFGLTSLSPATQLFSAQAEDTWKAWTPKITVDATFAQDILGYATISRGFKSGGFQGLAATAAAARTSFNPEEVTNYEAGLKTRFFDRRLTVNLAGYYMEFSDLQFRQRILTIPGDQSSAIVIVANAGEAEILGFEAESSLVVTPWLTLNANYAYTDSEITEFNATPGVADVTGLPLARAPKNTVTASADFNVPVGDYVIGARGEYRYRSSFLFEPSRDGALREPGYGLFDARVSFAPSDGAWSVEGWVRNIGDERYRVFAQAIGFSTAGTSSATSRTGDPRTFGLTLRARY